MMNHLHFVMLNFILDSRVENNKLSLFKSFKL